MQMLPVVTIEQLPWASIPHLPKSCHPVFAKRWIHNVLTELKGQAINQFGQYKAHNGSGGLVDLRSFELSNHTLIVALVAFEMPDTFAVQTETGVFLAPQGA
jgi:hypothetical protein